MFFFKHYFPQETNNKTSCFAQGSEIIIHKFKKGATIMIGDENETFRSLRTLNKKSIGMAI